MPLGDAFWILEFTETELRQCGIELEKVVEGECFPEQHYNALITNRQPDETIGLLLNLANTREPAQRGKRKNAADRECEELNLA